jgi:hypothetical protein
VTVRPGDERAAAASARGYLRASHADREHVIDTLKAAFVRGYVTKDEFDSRVSQTLGSRTYADLARVTADLPAGLAAGIAALPAGLASVQPPTAPAAKSASAPQRLGARDRVVIATAVLAGVAWVVAIVAVIPLAGVAAIISGLVSLVLGGSQIAAARREQNGSRTRPSFVTDRG